MKRINKKPPLFKNNVDVDDIISFYNITYKLPAKQLTHEHFAYDGQDISKLSPTEMLAEIRAQLLSTKVWLVETDEDVNKMLTYFSKQPLLSFDTETTNIKLATHPNVIMWSFAVNTAESFVVPYIFNTKIVEYLVTTEQMVVAHNYAFDGQLVHRMSGGRFIKNPHDTMLLMYSMINDSVLTPSLSLKELTKNQFGSWSQEVFDLQIEQAYDESIIYYAGIDAIGCYHLMNEHIDAINATPDVDLFDLLPAIHPSKRSYSRYYFYKNVARQLLNITIEMMNVGLPLNMDNVHKLDGELDIILGKADTEVFELPTVLKYLEEYKKNKAGGKVDKYKEKIDIEDVKIYKATNADYINMFVSTMYPDKLLPSKAKNWTPTVINTFDTMLAQAIKDKNLESLRYTPKYSDTFIVVEDIFRQQKIADKIIKSEVTANNVYERAMLDQALKPLASASQKKYLFKHAFGISSMDKSMTTGEDSFNKKELSRLAKILPSGTELHKYIELCLIYSGGAIVQNNFIKNFKEYSLNGIVHASYRLAGTKTFRASSGGGGSKLNLLNIPSSGSPYSKPIKKCIYVPSDEWVWLTLDFAGLEISVGASITNDQVLLNTLQKGYDQHCNNAASYFKTEIESVLGHNDGSLEWNKKFKDATETNNDLNRLRSLSKGITFSCQYLSSVAGLYKAVGYMGDTFESDIKVQGYKYTTDVKLLTDKKGKTYYGASRDAVWYDIENYKRLDSKYYEFFEKAVVPAKNMHYSFHNELYYGMRDYREQVVIPEAKKYKNLHLGMGMYINQTHPLNMSSIRTLNNSVAQYYSVLSLIALEKFRRIVYDKGYQDRIQIVSSIYDSVYVMVKKDAELIKWAANELKTQMEKDYIVDQPMPLIASPEISLASWADFTPLSKIKDLDSYLKGE